MLFSSLRTQWQFPSFICEQVVTTSKLLICHTRNQKSAFSFKNVFLHYKLKILCRIRKHIQTIILYDKIPFSFLIHLSYSYFQTTSQDHTLFLNIYTFPFTCGSQYKIIKYNPWNISFQQAIKIWLTILMPVENVTGFIGLGFSSCISNWVDLSLCWAKSRATGRSELSCKKS